MESNPHNASTSHDSARTTAISRRGGVRVRGGRLPPIRMRDIVSQTSSVKKTFAPNIPQRRVKVKEEISEFGEVTSGKQSLSYSDFQRSRGSSRSRGRGARVFIQTEGTFLGDGPAARVKKEPVDYEKISVPRTARKEPRASKTESEIKQEKEQIENLLDSYDTNEAFFDLPGYIQPVRLPLVKYECKKDIKQEPLEIEDIKSDVKEEAVENELKGSKAKFITPIKHEIAKDEIANNFIKDLQDITDEGIMILLQLPSVFPIADDDEKHSARASESEKEVKDESKKKSFFLKDKPEGFIGKMQVLKSGRMQLVIGPVIFELEPASDSESKKEVVSVDVKDDDRSSLTVLGKIDKKMVVRPVLPSIFQQMKYQESIEEPLVEN